MLMDFLFGHLVPFLRGKDVPTKADTIVDVSIAVTHNLNGRAVDRRLVPLGRFNAILPNILGDVVGLERNPGT